MKVKVLTCLSFCKYFGIYLDQSSSFKELVTWLNNKICSQLGLLIRVCYWKLNGLCSWKSLNNHDTSQVRLLRFFFCKNLAPSRYKSLEWLQTGAARIVLKDSNFSHHQLLCQLSWKSLKVCFTTYWTI